VSSSALNAARCDHNLRPAGRPAEDLRMDVVMVAVVLAFFVSALGLVSLCEGLMGGQG
jgi:hypothetical protein